MHDLASPAVPATPSARAFALPLALITGAGAVICLLFGFGYWSTLVDKLNWWESEDWALPSFILFWFALPAALGAAAIARRFGTMAFPPQDELARRSRWAVRLAGLPLLILPVMFLLAWSAPFEVTYDTPDVAERTGRLIQLAVYAAGALAIAAYGWVMPRANFRGWLRMAAGVIGGGAVLYFLLGLRSVSFSDLWIVAPMCAPLLVSCGLVWALTRSR